MADTGYEQRKKRPLEDEANSGYNKRSSLGGNHLPANQPLLKLLVPNYVAGALIGKGGGLMKEMKEQYGGYIRLSKKDEIYPGTDERIIVLAGETTQITDLNYVVMEKLLIEHNQPNVEPGRSEKVKIILTNAAAGLLIGKGGATIKSINEESKARISIANLDKVTVQGERVLTMTGSMEQRKEACRMIIEKISSESSNMANTVLNYITGNIGLSSGNLGLSSGNLGLSSGNIGLNSGNIRLNSGNISLSSGNIGLTSRNDIPMQYNNPEPVMTNRYPVKNSRSALPLQYNNHEQIQRYPVKSERNRFQDKFDQPILKTKVTVEVEVPDRLVGSIMGKQGHIIRDITQASGSRLQFSDKDEYEEGTSSDRVLTITADDLQKANTAYLLVNARIEELVGSSNGLPSSNHKNDMLRHSLLGGAY